MAENAEPNIQSDKKYTMRVINIYKIQNTKYKIQFLVKIEGIPLEEYIQRVFQIHVGVRGQERVEIFGRIAFARLAFSHRGPQPRAELVLEF